MPAQPPEPAPSPRPTRRAANSPPASPLAERPTPASTLHAAVLGTVRDMITTGELAPGVRLTERVLTERLSVSRTPLREALKVLAHEGLVDLLPNCGARVTRLTAPDARHLFEVLEALESQAGRLACERMTEAELSDLKAAHHEMHACFLRRELPAYFRLNQSIHERIVTAARNPILQIAHATYSSRIRRARYQELQANGVRWNQAMAEHEQIVQALEERDQERLAAVLKAHLHEMFRSAFPEYVAD